MLLAQLTVPDPTVCDIEGTYTFNGATLLCRDDGLGTACQTGLNPTTSIYFDFDTTNLCDADALDPSASIVPQLTAYTDSSLTNPTTEFYTGEGGFFLQCYFLGCPLYKKYGI